MDPSGHPGSVTSPELSAPGNLEILAHTAASQASEDPYSYAGFPVLKLHENAHIPLLSQHVRIEGQPGGPMLGQTQLQKLLGVSDHLDKGLSPGPLSIITTTSISDTGQQSPASLSHHGSQMYKSGGTSGDAMLSAINYSENEILHDSTFDMSSNLGNLDDGILSGIGHSSRLGDNPSEQFGLFDEDGDSLNMETLSPNNLILDTGSLAGVHESGDSNISDHSQSYDEGKKGKGRGKNGKGSQQLSPGKGGGNLECNLCHKIFNNTSALAKHKLTHSDERKFLCTICEKKFKRQDHLNGHLMTHREKKPYECMVSHCEKSYCDARSLKRHLENHHNHSADVIALEMVEATSHAAEVLAEASTGQPVQLAASAKNPVVSASRGSGANLISMATTESVINLSTGAPANQQREKTSVKQETNVLAQQLMIEPQVGPAVMVTIPLTIHGSYESDAPEPTPTHYIPLQPQQQHQLTPAQIEAIIKFQQQQQHQQQEQYDSQQLQQFFQDQAAMDQNEENMSINQMEKFQHQQQQQLPQTPSTTQSSPTSSWHTPNNPDDPDLSPGYSEMSPSNQEALSIGSPIRPQSHPTQGQSWFSQTQPNVIAPNTTVTDIKVLGDESTKPVVCTICHRRFKNIPALNGHMRLHGGYFKKEASLKEEKKKKSDMAPPSLTPSRPQGVPLGGSPVGGAGKMSKGTPPLQSPPSEEVEEILQQQLKLHARHWKEKQEQQLHQQIQQELHQQLQLHEQQQQQQQQQQLFQQQLQSYSSQSHIQTSTPLHVTGIKPLKNSSQTVQEHLNQKLIEQEQLKQQQIQFEEIQKQQQLQLAAQSTASMMQDNQSNSLQGGTQLNHLQLLQLVGAHGGLELGQLEMLKIIQQLQEHQFKQQQQQQQQQQQLESQSQIELLQQQLMYEASTQEQALGGHDMQFVGSPISQQVSHLTSSPQYPSHPHSVPQSPLLQRQGSVESLRSPPGAQDYNKGAHQQGLAEQESIGLSSRFADQGVHDYGQVHVGSNGGSLLQLQGQMQSQNVGMSNLHGDLTFQSQHLANVHNSSNNTNIVHRSDMDLEASLHQDLFNQNLHFSQDQSGFQSPYTGGYRVSDELVSNPGPGGHIDNSDSEIVSQIITSLENLGEVPPGSMHQVNKSHSHHLPQLSNQVFASENDNLFQAHPVSENCLGVSSDEFAHHNAAVSVQTLSTNYNMAFGAPTSVSEPRVSVKQELLKHLATKPSSPRAAQSLQFSFQNNSNGSNVSNSNINYMQRQRHHSAKAELNPIPVLAKSPNSELKRRLSSGPEDVRAHVLFSPTSAPDLQKRESAYLRPPLTRSDEGSRPRLRSKSGDDFRLHKHDDPFFVKPRNRVDDYAQRPRSKTNEHLSDWSNMDFLSRSDGAGVFRNPSAMAPGSSKIRRKNRPAPLIIPSHTNHCGFQSRLRSPRIHSDGENGTNTMTVPYTPPPMLSPLRRGSGLFSSIHHSGLTPQPLMSSGPPSTPLRPSLLRSASVQKSEDLLDDTVSFEEEQPPPESDTHPHVNIGPQYQAALPAFRAGKKLALNDISRADLVFDPVCVKDVTELELRSYQNLAWSSVLSGNGFNVEYALHVLYIAGGSIEKAMLMLMSGPCKLPKNHPLMSYSYQESDIWSPDEIERYTQAILKVDKDFFQVAREVKTKTVRQCVQFYYLWKKVLVDDHKRLRAMRRRREQDYNLRSTRAQPDATTIGPQQVVITGTEKVEEAGVDEDEEEEVQPMEEEEEEDVDSLSEASTSVGTFDDHNEKDLETEELVELPVPSPARSISPVVVFSCSFHECSSKFSSKAALSAHMKIHQQSMKPASMVYEDRYDGKAATLQVMAHQYKAKQTTTPPSRSPVNNQEQKQDVFPCKLCGRVFAKVKSRSAHMKIHRPDQDKEKEKKAKIAKQQAAVAAANAAKMEALYENQHNYQNLQNGPPTML